MKDLVTNRELFEAALIIKSAFSLKKEKELNDALLRIQNRSTINNEDLVNALEVAVAAKAAIQDIVDHYQSFHFPNL